MGSGVIVQNVTNEGKIKPKARFVINISPYLPIDKNEDGTGGGMICRVYGEGYEPEFVRIEWGKSTEIEIEGVKA